MKASTEVKTDKTDGKARHRWSKEVSETAFFVDAFESKATIFWRKSHEMVIQKGAILKKEAPKLKDGSEGFSAMVGHKLREDHKSSIKDFVTTEDIILKSVNEVGHFLYFAGTNSWLQMFDEHGKSIHEWTVAQPKA